eukprot:12910211-Prorocentrum_lima.AAC.1
MHVLPSAHKILLLQRLDVPSARDTSRNGQSGQNGHGGHNGHPGQNGHSRAAAGSGMRQSASSGRLSNADANNGSTV